MKLKDVIESPPEASALGGLEAVAERDPVLWCALNRRVKGEALIYDNARRLSPESLGFIQKTLIRSDYERELYSRLLHHRPFLKQPLRDDHKHKASQKGRQIGWSELAVSEVFHFLSTHPGTKLILTFPRDKQLADFSITRIGTAFNESPRMAALAGIPNQVFTKKIGESFLIMRSAWESNLGEGVDADAVFLDEKDRMRDKVELAFRESLKSSKYGLFREYSTPTLPGRGINVAFNDSDQQVWMVKCEKCGEYQEVDWQKNIVRVKDFPEGTKELPPESYEYLCHKVKCRGKLDRVFSGQWVARFPSRKHIRGYHVPQFIAPWISATRVMQDKIDFKWLQPWLNYVAALPGSMDDALVSDVDFQNACAGHEFVLGRTDEWSQITAGIDWGYFNWVFVLGRSSINGLVYLLNIGIFEDSSEELRSAKDVERFLGPYSPDLVIADAGYGKDRNSYLLRRLCPVGNEDRFYAQWYNPSAHKSRTFQPEWSDPARARVLVDRTMQIKNICHAIKEREFGLASLALDKMQILHKHFRALALMKEIDDDTKEMIEAIASSGDDHLVHAAGSAWLAMEKLSKKSPFSFSFEG
jgi:hypothetical protein